jgi:G3E family GTPase
VSEIDSTTLLSNSLKEPDLGSMGIAVIELDDVRIDHLLVERATKGVIKLCDGLPVLRDAQRTVILG